MTPPRWCPANVSYAHSSLGPYGDRTLAEVTDEHFRSFMKLWEQELNHFLRTRARLEGVGSEGHVDLS